jgi:uncharacterized protein DUF5678
MDGRRREGDGMAEPIKVPQEETAEEYVARIRDLVERDRVGGARKLVVEALERFPDHWDLMAWKKILSPAKVIKVGGPLDRDRTPEYRWLDEYGPQYRGEWVAVLGDRLLAHALTLKDLDAKLDETPTDFSPLVVKIPSAPPWTEWSLPG